MTIRWLSSMPLRNPWNSLQRESYFMQKPLLTFDPARTESMVNEWFNNKMPCMVFVYGIYTYHCAHKDWFQWHDIYKQTKKNPIFNTSKNKNSFFFLLFTAVVIIKHSKRNNTDDTFTPNCKLILSIVCRKPIKLASKLVIRSLNELHVCVTHS